MIKKIYLGIVTTLFLISCQEERELMGAITVKTNYGYYTT